jgi:copper chaperone CopZ
MTCNGCRSHVEKVLNEVPGVKNASVDLEKAEAEVEMERHIKTEEFQQALESKMAGLMEYQRGLLPERCDRNIK